MISLAMKQSFLLRLNESKLINIKKSSKDMGLSANEYINFIIDEKRVAAQAYQEDNPIIKVISKSSLFEKIEGIILFGSVAKKVDTNSSDIDLLLVMNQGTRINRSLYSVWDDEIESKLTKIITASREVSPHFVEYPMTIDDVHSLWLEVSISGIPLYKRTNKIDQILEKIRLAIAENKFIRKNSHGQPYWIRNENN